jgi:transcriptional regulator with GAF, ATPase, and Fis domain
MGRHSALFLRGGSTVLLSKINVYTRRTTINPDKTASEISFLNNRENTYRVRRLNTNHLATISGLPAQGFMFEDISLFRQRIHRLEEEYSREQAEKKRLQGMLEMRRENRLLMIGKSDKLSSIREKVELLAGTNATILIEGETGTGKDVLARYIHEVSESENAPFIKVDCSSIPPTLIESELFGHKKGAFTGAIDNRRGKFELANGGTIFLDEVSNIPIDVQVKLLGVLQDLTVQPIGGSRPVHLNVRIISASNRNLQELVKTGKFREDLYYRLNVIRFVLPPLRERKEDIPVLANYFLESLCKEYKKSEMQFSPESYRLLDTYNWSGNIRELRAVIQKAVLFSTGEAINPSDLQLTNQSTVTTAVPIKRGEKRILHNLPDEELKALLMRNNGIVYKSAMALGVTRKALYDHLRKKGFPIDTFRKGQT